MKETTKKDNTNNSEENEKSDRLRELEIASAKAVEEIKRLHEELEGLNDKYLRVVAEYDNFKKRTAKEKEEIFAFAKMETIKSLLPVFDNLERAKSVNENDKLKEGVIMIIKHFEDTLSKIGISEIDVEGKAFDPQLCEAVAHIEDESLPENTVSEVLQKGYILGDKVIRHAIVKVAN